MKSESAPIQRRLLSSSAVEGLPGWETRLYLVEYPPGADGSGHYHSVVGLGYMISGNIVSAFGDDPAIEIHSGEAFEEAANRIHTISRNASETEPLSFVIAYTVKQREPVTVFPA